MRRRTTGTAAVAGVLALSLLGCGSQTDTYCDELAEDKQELTDLAGRAGEPEADVLTGTLDIWRDLHEEAPGDIEDEWSTLVFALEGLVEAFGAAGTTPGAFDPATPPEGVSPEDADRVRDAAAELASARVTSSGRAVEQHARDVCGTDLGLNTG